MITILIGRLGVGSTIMVTVPPLYRIADTVTITVIIEIVGDTVIISIDWRNSQTAVTAVERIVGIVDTITI